MRFSCSGQRRKTVRRMLGFLDGLGRQDCRNIRLAGSVSAGERGGAEDRVSTGCLLLLLWVRDGGLAAGGQRGKRLVLGGGWGVVVCVGCARWGSQFRSKGEKSEWLGIDLPVPENPHRARSFGPSSNELSIVSCATAFVTSHPDKLLHATRLICPLASLSIGGVLSQVEGCCSDEVHPYSSAYELPARCKQALHRLTTGQ